NGSGLENFSTDDVEETFYSKNENVNPLSYNGNYHNNMTTNNQLAECHGPDRTASQVSLTMSIDESKMLSASK
ncbi:unnamed protein product, partial [Rotaria magnacalcarata]